MQASNSSPRLTPEQTALVTAHLVQLYQKEKGKEVTRFRLSRNSVRLLGLRATLREAYTDEWREALASDWGWIAFPHGEEFGLIRSSAVSGWVRIGTKRVAADRKKLKTGDRSVLTRIETELAQLRADEEEVQEE